MRKGFLTLNLMLFGAFLLKAQCDGCQPIAGTSIDYCHHEADIAKCSAQFSQDTKTFYYQNNNRKKDRLMQFQLPEGDNVPSTSYLLGLDPDHKLKLSASDLLFVEHAVTQWQQMEGIRLWSPAVVNSGYTILPSGLAYKPLVIGKGKIPETGKRVNVHYTGYLENGKKFDSSLDRKQSFQFTLGLGQVIKGWDEGLSIMTVGSRYLLRIPPALGYGAAGAGGGAIPPHSTLFFDVQLISAE
jgi:hypothetical protein